MTRDRSPAADMRGPLVATLLTTAALVALPGRGHRASQDPRRGMGGHDPARRLHDKRAARPRGSRLDDVSPGWHAQ